MTPREAKKDLLRRIHYLIDVSMEGTDYWDRRPGEFISAKYFFMDEAVDACPFLLDDPDVRAWLGLAEYLIKPKFRALFDSKWWQEILCFDRDPHWDYPFKYPWWFWFGEVIGEQGLREIRVYIQEGLLTEEERAEFEAWKNRP